ncbi:serine O-acetyltransferase [Chitinophaga costaii]|uniref:serine O-acetyltransferase n=1 Tax=Chitinophaga costaii TaxID=1335309 RepID=UPI001F0C9440
MSLGFSIPINIFEEGLCIVHYGSIVASRHAKIGKNCTIHSCVNIGGSSDRTAAKIGDNCFIGPGVKIFNTIEIGNNVKMGANAVVNKSFEDGNVVIAGTPAKIVRQLIAT